jgi:hypothetical protein
VTRRLIRRVGPRYLWIRSSTKERSPCKRRAAGSIPAVSTMTTSADIHNEMIGFGFWNPENFNQFSGFLALRTWMQLSHALTEYSEVKLAGDEASALVEMADIAIVLLDLAGAHNIVIDTLAIRSASGDFVVQLGRLMDVYRKTATINVSRIERLLGILYVSKGALLWDAVNAKMEINRLCPKTWGVAAVPARPTPPPMFFIK